MYAYKNNNFAIFNKVFIQFYSVLQIIKVSKSIIVIKAGLIRLSNVFIFNRRIIPNILLNLV